MRLHRTALRLLAQHQQGSAPAIVLTSGFALSACVLLSKDSKDSKRNLSVETTTLKSSFYAQLFRHSSPIATTACAEDFKEDDRDDDHFSEPARYEQSISYHGSLIDDYRSRWDYEATRTPTTTSTSWIKGVPVTEQEITMLEYDFQYASGKYRDDLQFRLAAYYLETDESPKKALRWLQELAVKGHLDAMCLFGIIWTEGRHVDADPSKACVWFNRAAESGHMQACYEMGVAYYTGEGVPEEEGLAVDFFERAASMGHAAAAYMLGDCLLDGVGVMRDRAEALEWLVAAGEMGHRGARSRVLAVLEQADYGNDNNTGTFTDASRQSFRRRASDIVDEDKKWTEVDTKRLVTLEKTFTIGGGSRNPVVLARRKTVVSESREEPEEQPEQPIESPEAPAV